MPRSLSPLTRPNRSTVARTAAGSLALATVLALAACGGSSADDSAASTAKEIKVVVTADGCSPDVSKVNAGPLTFAITNKDATAVSEVELLSGQRILGEKENLAPGFSGSFSLSLQAGEYTVFCPGAKTARFPLTVTGTATASGSDTEKILNDGAKLYAVYVENQTDLLVAATKDLGAAIAANNLATAKTAYAKARIYYERIEPVAESFVSKDQDLDADIDAREGDVPTNEWKGFHVIEKALFSNGSTAGMTPVATELLTNVTKLQTLCKGLEYQPAELANGAVGLLEEVSSGKITGEEDRYSKLDIVDMVGNVEGSQQAFAYLEPGLAKIDKALSETVTQKFNDLNALLDTYRDPNALGGYKPYNTLTDADTKKLAAAVTAVSEPLSRVAAKVA